MKVCLVTGYPPNIGRGAESSWLLVEELAKYEEIEEVYVLGNYNGESIEIKNKVRIFRIWKENRLSNAFLIFRKILEIRPDVVHIVYSYLFYGSPFYSSVFTTFIFFLLKFMRIPLVVTIHQIFALSDINKNFQQTFSAHMPLFLIKIGFYILNKIISWCSDIIIMLHKRHKEILLKDYKIKNTFYIPIGLREIRPFSQDEAKEILGLKNKFILLFFGFIAPFKGIEFVIEAIRFLRERIDNIFFIIAGSILPSLKNDFNTINYTKLLKKSIQVVDMQRYVMLKDYYISEEEAALLFSSADIVVLPYQQQSGPSEIFKKASLYKIPVVASDIDYLKEDVIDGTTGILVSPKDPHKLSSAIVNLYKDKSLYNLIKKNIGRVSKEYDIKRTAQLHLQLYKDIYER